MKIKNVSVARKIIIYFILSSFVISMIGMTFSLFRDFIQYQKEIKERFKMIKKSHMPSLATSLYTENLPQIKNIISGILSVQDMVYLEIKLDDDEGDKVAYKGGVKGKENVLSYKMRVVYSSLDEDDSLTPMGYLTIQASLAGVTTKIKNQIKVFVIIQLVQFILVSIIMYNIFRLLVSKHLERMSNYAESIDLIDLSGPDLHLERTLNNERDELDHVVISLNKMKAKLQHSHEQLKDYSENLEVKVKDATQEIENEKNKVDNLLNNMKQAIFVVDEDLNVIPPVSHYTGNVFDGNIVGENLFDTLFKDFNKNSEIVANIQSALSLVFGDDYIQYELVEEHLLKKINYFSELSGDKTLSISYTPLFNKDELLENLMLVVDDITEKEKLEAEVVSEKESNQKNIAIITEMAKAEIDDLEIFLDNAKGILQKSMILAKSTPNEENILHELFRFLHTLKGSARAFNFDSISSIAHLVESAISENLEMVKKEIKLGRENYEPLIDNLYILSQEVLEYGNLAKKVFKIENEFGKKLIVDIQNHIVDIENITLINISPQNHFLVKTEAFKKRKLIFSKIQKNPPSQSSVERLKRATHSLKGSLRASSALTNLSETVHAFEKSFVYLKNIGTTNLDDFSDHFVENYFYLKDTLKSNFIQSHMSNPYTTYKEDWANIFSNIFKLSLSFDQKTLSLDSKGVFILDVIASRSEKIGFQLIAKEANDLKNINLGRGGSFSESEKNVIFSIMRDLWNYIVLVAKLDFYHLESNVERSVQSKLVAKIGPFDNEPDIVEIKKILDENEIKTIFLLTIKKLLDDSYSIKAFSDEVKKWSLVKEFEHFGEVFGNHGDEHAP
ncbi:MAG: Hpt domain-containing protein, partial [Bdellovibrionota bacterium]|nr:Hpt domain-containing protein [Bdellovibrionota bacterium]